MCVSKLRVQHHAFLLAIATCIAPAWGQQHQSRPTAGPVQELSAHWKADAQISSHYGAQRLPDYYWVGLMWGAISASGRIDFATDEGCTITGVVSPTMYASYMGTAQASNCKEATMNRRYTVTIVGNTPNLIIRLNDSVVSKSVTDTFDIKGTFVRY